MKLNTISIVSWHNIGTNIGVRREPLVIPEILQAQVSMKLVSYIEGNVDSATFIFKLSEFHVLYENRLHELGIQKAVNKPG